MNEFILIESLNKLIKDYKYLNAHNKNILLIHFYQMKKIKID
jgi:hypothetical protein